MRNRILLVSCLTLLVVGGLLAGCDDFWVDQGTAGSTKFVFVANQNNGGTSSVSAYAADPNSGVLSSFLNSPFATATNTLAISADARGTFLYALNGTGSISGFGIDRTNIKLVSTGVATPTGTNPVALVVDPLGAFVYVAEAGPPTRIRGFSIPSTGVLAELASSPFALTSTPNSLTIDARGLFLFVGTDDGKVLSFPIQADGSLGTMQSVNTPSGVKAMAADPAVRFLYAADGVNGVSAFTINNSTGALTLVSGSPFPTGLGPVSVAVDSVGKFVYVANRDSNTVSAFQINLNNGALTASPSSPFATNTQPVSVAVDPSVRFVYVVNKASNNVSVYVVDQNIGTLTPASTPNTATGTAPVWVIATQ